MMVLDGALEARLRTTRFATTAERQMATMTTTAILERVDVLLGVDRGRFSTLPLRLVMSSLATTSARVAEAEAEAEAEAVVESESGPVYHDCI